MSEIDNPAKPLLRGWIHAVAAVALVTLSPWLITRSSLTSHRLWSLCFLVGVEIMLVTSALFHRVTWTPARRRAMRRADHSAIFFAIAGSYLAVGGLTMHGTFRVVMLSLIGGGALVGVAIRQLSLDAPKWVNTLPYLVMGWSAIGVLPQMYRGGGREAFFLILGGGLAYSLGALCYALKRPRLRPAIAGYHEVFHALTIVGAGCHFAAVYILLAR